VAVAGKRGSSSLGRQAVTWRRWHQAESRGGTQQAGRHPRCARSAQRYPGAQAGVFAVRGRAEQPRISTQAGGRWQAAGNGRCNAGSKWQASKTGAAGRRHMAGSRKRGAFQAAAAAGEVTKRCSGILVVSQSHGRPR